MAQLELLNEQGQATSKVEASDVVFGREYNEALVHQVVVAYQANARQGTRAQKDREQVKHSTKKPFKQKGTGRARAGMTSSPLWRGGGRIFPNSPEENFTQKINKKMYRAGMASIFSQLAREGRLAVVDSLKVDSPKTKVLADKFKAMNLKSVLVIADEVDEPRVQTTASRDRKRRVRRTSMAITRFDPFREFMTVQERMNRLFGQAYLRDEELSRAAWVPPVDIYETEQHDLVIKAELPDMAREDIEVTVEHNTLTLKGTKLG